MPDQPNTTPAPGWVGGFAQSKPEFAYPDPDLSSLDMLCNLANIDKLDRQQAVLWPEFSWETQKADTDTRRCYQMFAPDISRLGYTNDGRVYSIICPQQGIVSPALGAINAEVTVTGQRGWVDETTKTIAADLSVVGKIWFSPSASGGFLYKMFWNLFKNSSHNFPATKEHAIIVKTHLPDQKDQVDFPLSYGESTDFPIPDFARHTDKAWSVGNLAVEIGEIEPTGDPVADEFNQMVLDAFNLASGNMLQNGNTLTWNVWFDAPGLVDQDEWRNHAEVWRKSIDADHGSPDGPGTDARYFDGSPFKAGASVMEHEEEAIVAFIKKNI